MFDEEPDGDPHGECAAEIRRLTEENEQLRREVAHWKNNHETEVRRARTLKERTDMPFERVDAYEKWGEDLIELALAYAEIRKQVAGSHVVFDRDLCERAKAVPAQPAVAM